LPDVLVLLSSTKKTGELKVSGARGEGRVWVDQGQIVHSQKDGKSTAPVDTIFELLRLEEGTFSFHNDAAPPTQGEPQLVDLVLSDAQGRLSEWRDIERVVPHLDAVVDMSADAPGDEVTVSNAQWKLLVAVAGGHSVTTLMDRLDRSEFDTCKAVKELVEARMATIDVDAKPSAKVVEARAAKADAAKADAKSDEKAAPAKAEAKSDDKDESKAGMAKAGDKEPVKEPVKAEANSDAKPGDDASSDDGDDADQLNRARRVRATTSASGSESKSGAWVDAVKEGGPLASLDANGTSNANGTGKAKDDSEDHRDDDTEALVAQLAALGVDEDDPEVKEKIAARLAAEEAAAEGEEPINRGLLLKFLSSVRN